MIPAEYTDPFVFLAPRQDGATFWLVSSRPVSCDELESAVAIVEDGLHSASVSANFVNSSIEFDLSFADVVSDPPVYWSFGCPTTEERRLAGLSPRYSVCYGGCRWWAQASDRRWRLGMG